jgi:hypothetical protein
MKTNDKTSDGLNQIFEIINAKGDEGEIKEIVENKNEKTSQNSNE